MLCNVTNDVILRRYCVNYHLFNLLSLLFVKLDVESAWVHNVKRLVVKKIIIELYEKQLSQCQIANLLELNRSIICWIINRFKQCGAVENRPWSGRSPSLYSSAKRIGWINMPQIMFRACISQFHVVSSSRENWWIYNKILRFVMFSCEQFFCEVTHLRVTALQWLLLFNLCARRLWGPYL